MQNMVDTYRDASSLTRHADFKTPRDLAEKSDLIPWGFFGRYARKHGIEEFIGARYRNHKGKEVVRLDNYALVGTTLALVHRGVLEYTEKHAHMGFGNNKWTEPVLRIPT